MCARQACSLRALRSYSYELRTISRCAAHILDLPPDRARSQKSFACISNKLSSEDLNASIVSITDIDISFLVHC